MQIIPGEDFDLEAKRSNSVDTAEIDWVKTTALKDLRKAVQQRYNNECISAV